MGAITILPALFTAIATVTVGFREALVYVGLPALVLLPNYYTWSLPGLPDARFRNYLLLVLGIALVASRDRSLYRFHPVDLVPLAFLLTTAMSQGQAESLGAMRHQVASGAMLLIAPWVLGRAAANHSGLLCGIVRCLLLCGAFIGLVAPFEARFGRNPFDFLRGIWGHDVPWDGALYRLGLRRTAGPLAHPICLGFFYTMIIPAGYWLVRVRMINRAFGISCLALCALGLFLTISRGPIISMMLVIVLLWLTALAHRPHYRSAALVLLVVATVGCGAALFAYASIGRQEAASPAQESAAYRLDMIENYMPLLSERPWLGFGKDLIPVVDGQKSIDNQFLLVALQHGVPAGILSLLVVLFPTLMLMQGLRREGGPEALRSGARVLIAILLAAVITQLTVFSGPQTTQILLIFAGAAATVSTRIGSGAYTDRQRFLQMGGQP